MVYEYLFFVVIIKYNLNITYKTWYVGQTIRGSTRIRVNN